MTVRLTRVGFAVRSGVTFGVNEMKYSKEYHNQEWLYAVWRAQDNSDHILTAIHPGVGWQDVVLRLNKDETDILRRSEDEFTDFVKEVVANRDTPRIKRRRIESKVLMTGSDEILLEE